MANTTITGNDALEALSLLSLSDDVLFFLLDVGYEVRRQRDKWGEQRHDDFFWLGIATEEIGEVAKGLLDNSKPHEVDMEMVQLAAVLASWAECRKKRR